MSETPLNLTGAQIATAGPMPRTIVLLAVALAQLMAKEAAIPGPKTGQIYSHGTIRQTGRQTGCTLEAVVEVAAELLANIHAGQQVLMDVRQGQLRGVVKLVRSRVEVTVALDASRSKIKFSRLQDGQAVIAAILLDPDCDCEIPELR